MAIEEFTYAVPTVIILVVVFGAAGTTMAVIMSGDPDLTATLDSFNNFVNELNSLVLTEGAYNYIENIPMYVGKEYDIIFFNETETEKKIILTRNFIYNEGSQKYEGDYYIVDKPSECLNLNCICLYKINSRANCNKIHEEIFLYQCEIINEKINFLTDISNKESQKYEFRKCPPPILRISENFNSTFLNPCFYLKKDFDFESLEYTDRNENSDRLVDFCVSGKYDMAIIEERSLIETLFKFRPSRSEISYGFKNLNLYFFNLSKINNDNDEILVFAIYNNSWSEKSEEYFDRLIHRDSHEYRTRILGSQNPLDRIILFKDYFDYSSQYILKEINLDDQMKSLGSNTLFMLFRDLLNTNTLVKNLSHLENYEFKITTDDCKGTVNDVVCRKMLADYSRSNIYLLYNNITYFLNKTNPEEYEKAMLYLADLYFKEKYYTLSNDLYFNITRDKYIGKSFKDPSDNDVVLNYDKDLFWYLLKDDNDLIFMREPLRVYHKASVTISVTSENIFFIEVFDNKDDKGNYTYNNVTYQFNVSISTLNNEYINLVSLKNNLGNYNKEKIFTVIQLYNHLKSKDYSKEFFDNNMNFDKYLKEVVT